MTEIAFSPNLEGFEPLDLLQHLGGHLQATRVVSEDLKTLTRV